MALMSALALPPGNPLQWHCFLNPLESCQMTSPKLVIDLVFKENQPDDSSGLEEPDHLVNE